MSAVETALQTIRRVAAKVKTADFARMADVPYTTLRDWESRDFTGPQIEAFQKLAAAAEHFEAQEAAGDTPHGAPA